MPVSETHKIHKILAFFALCLGYFMIVIDTNIINVALPSIAKELNGSITNLQWVVDGYILTFACLLLSAGYIADQWGAKLGYLIGLFIFVAMSIACGLSNDFISLTIFRLLQGIGAAILVPTSMSLLHASYENPKERANAIGIWAAVSGIAAASGPMLGGLLTAWLSWRWVFFVNIPIGIFSILLVIKYLEHAPQHVQNSGFDVWGQLLGIIAIASMALAFIETGREGWSNPIVWTALIISIFSIVLFIQIEKRVAFPILPIHFFKVRNFSLTNGMGFLVNFTFYGILFMLPLYFQNIRHFSITETGFAIMPIMLFASPASFFGGKLAGNFGIRTPIILGITLALLGFMALIFSQFAMNYIWEGLSLSMMSFGISTAMPPLVTSNLNSLPGHNAGVTSATFNTSRQLGGLLGVAVTGSILKLSTIFMFGMTLSLLISTLLCFLLIYLGYLLRN